MNQVEYNYMYVYTMVSDQFTPESVKSVIGLHFSSIYFSVTASHVSCLLTPYPQFVPVQGNGYFL